MSPPSETSPLLSNQADQPDPARAIKSPVNHQDTGTEQNGDVERGSDAARQAQFQGLPEVKKQLKYILPSLSIGLFLVAADQTLVAATSGKMGSDMNSLNNVSWIATAYFLTLTSFQPLYGKLSDIFGRKQCLLFAYTVFGLGCLFCGLAETIEQLIIARAVAGIGGGGMMTVVSIMMSDIIPLRERGTWQGIINIIFAAGSSSGAPLGGFLSDTIGWRVAFIAQFPLCMVAFLAVFFTLKLPAREKAHWKSKLKRIDFPGAVMLILTIASLLVGLDRGSNGAWTSTITIVSLALFPFFGAVFLTNEFKFAKEPFAPSRIIFDRSMAAAYLCNLFSMAGWFGVLFYIPLFYQASQNATATEGGLRLLPSIILGVIGSLGGGFVIQKTGKYRWLTVASYGLPVIGATMLYAFSALDGIKADIGVSVALTFGGLGLGSGTTTTLIAVISNAAPEDQAIATACSYLFRSLGSVTGISVLSAIIQQQLRTRLQSVLGSGREAEEIVLRVRESLEYIKHLDPDMARLVRIAYAESIRSAFAAILATLSVAFISSFFIREKKLNR